MGSRFMMELKCCEAAWQWVMLEVSMSVKGRERVKEYGGSYSGRSEMEYVEIMDELKRLSNPANIEGMARYGINPHNTYGVTVAELRGMAKRVGRDHLLGEDKTGRFQIGPLDSLRCPAGALQREGSDTAGRAEDGVQT
jgi:hypothetical protein